MQRKHYLLCALLSAWLNSHLFAGETGPEFSVDIDILVQTGVSSPDGNGVFGNVLSPPILNNQSQALVWSNLVATTDPGTLDDNGFFRLTRSGMVTLTRGGDPVSNGGPLNLSAQLLTQQLGRFAQQGLADDGALYFVIPDTQNVLRYLRADGQTLDTLLTSGDMTAFTDQILLFTQFFNLNDIGHPHFIALTPESVNGVIDSDGPRLLTTPGAMLPDGREVIRLGFGLTSRINNQDQMAVPVQTSDTPGNNFGLYRTDGDEIIKLLHLGEPAVDGLGTYTAPNGIATISESGTSLVLQFVDDFANDYSGLFFHDGMQLSELLRTGSAADGPGTITNISAGLALNSNDVAVFHGPQVDEFGNQLLTVLMHYEASIQPVLSEFELLPPPIDLETRGPFGYALNEQDQLVIFGFVIADGVSRRAIFFYDPEFGLALVARAGMALAGSVISDLDMALPLNTGQNNLHNSNATNAINDLGEVAFSFILENGQAGAALASVEFVDENFLFADGFESVLE